MLRPRFCLVWREVYAPGTIQIGSKRLGVVEMVVRSGMMTLKIGSLLSR
jgi:hypothetical protein